MYKNVAHTHAHSGQACVVVVIVIDRNAVATYCVYDILLSSIEKLTYPYPSRA